MSRILVDQIRSNSASADALTLDGSGNLTIPGNLTCSGNTTLSGNASLSGTATGFGGGKVLQVVSTSGNAIVTATGTTLQLLTASITPSATTSKILILSTLSCQGQPSSNVYGVHKLYRGSISGTEIFNTSAGQNSSFYNYMNIVITFIDSPNTTSATSYTTGINRNSGGTTSVSSDGTTYTLILMEIGA